jgi:D-sedoheptulose 7-phosphate isomerase
MGIKTMDSRCRRVIRDMVDCAVCIPSNSTPRIQEAHILVEHILCEILEEAFS